MFFIFLVIIIGFIVINDVGLRVGKNVILILIDFIFFIFKLL